METIVIALMLVPLVLLNVLMSQGKIMGRQVGKLAGKLVPKDEVAAPDVEALRRRMTKVLNLLKLGVTLLTLGLGVYALAKGGATISLSTISMIIAAALAFRNGADLSRMVVYTRHDAAIISARSSDIPAGGLLTRILAVGMISNALFLALWSVLFFTVQAGVKTAAGVDVNQLAIILWAAGILGGLAIALAVARKETRFLLRDELGVGVFLGLVRLHHLGEGIREATAERINLPRLWRPRRWRIPSPPMAGR